MVRSLAYSVVTALLVSLAGPALATTFSASAGAGIVGQPAVTQDQTSASSATATATVGGTGPGINVAEGTGSAVASPGLLGVHASAFVSDEFSNVHSGGIAQFDSFEVVVTGPASAPVPVSFNLLINGVITGEFTASAANTAAHPNGTVEISSAVQLCSSCSADVVNGRVDVGLDGFVPGQMASGHAVTSGTGQLAGYSGGSRVITSSVFMPTPGTPFDLSMLFHANMFNVVAAGMDLDFEHTVSFVSGEPVFNLPDGYTVNSVDGTTIVNNRFVAPVPEPTTLLLLASGLGGIAGLHRRRLRR